MFPAHVSPFPHHVVTESQIRNVLDNSLSNKFHDLVVLTVNVMLIATPNNLHLTWDIFLIAR
jgi:hypothetical protein